MYYLYLSDGTGNKAKAVPITTEQANVLESLFVTGTG